MDRLIAAASLDTVDGTGRTLAVEASSSGAGGGDVALGSGAFGKVGTYRYHGATVAVKELKAGADAESIGALLLLFLVSCLSVYVLHRRHNVVATTAPCMRVLYAIAVPCFVDERPDPHPERGTVIINCHYP